jgi:NAD-dependent SIR2 family protein deacetylase
MSIERTELLKNYVAAMHEGDAALFIGAGMSRPAGFVDWKGLLRNCAKELDLDIDREHDLVAVAQYYLNRRSSDRSRLNQILKDEFDKPIESTKSHEVIARLSISTIWTTNFDIGRNLFRSSKATPVSTAE